MQSLYLNQEERNGNGDALQLEDCCLKSKSIYLSIYLSIYSERNLKVSHNPS